jgi:uncharacterized membrane protein YdjX (TVP38/TMEM64 family)
MQSPGKPVIRLENEHPERDESLSPEQDVTDPERLIKPERWVDEEAEATTSKIPWVRALGTLVVLLGLAAAWRWTPLEDVVSIENLEYWAVLLRTHRLAPIIVIAVYVLGSMFMVPLTLLIVLTALTFDPLPAATYSMLGGVMSAVVSFYLGHLIGKDTVRRLAGSRLNRLSRKLSQRGFLAVVAARNLPLGPFTIVNAVAGASHIGLRDFTLGTIVGLLPGVAAVTLFESRLETVIRHPNWGSMILLFLAGCLIAAGFIALRRLLSNLRT